MHEIDLYQLQRRVAKLEAQVAALLAHPAVGIMLDDTTGDPPPPSGGGPGHPGDGRRAILSDEQHSRDNRGYCGRVRTLEDKKWIIHPSTSCGIL